jgi:hypothetical protein
MKNGRAGMADTTVFEAKCEILADVWMEYRDDEAFTDLIEFADLGFPLAYAVSNGIVQNNEAVEDLVTSTFDLLLKLLKVEDTGFENINHLFDTAEKNNQ